VREWQYWTRNKLEILSGYLPAFNLASQIWPNRLYIDLMAGEPSNRDARTGEEFDGSARLALSANTTDLGDFGLRTSCDLVFYAAPGTRRDPW